MWAARHDYQIFARFTATTPLVFDAASESQVTKRWEYRSENWKIWQSRLDGWASCCEPSTAVTYDRNSFGLCRKSSQTSAATVLVSRME